MSKYIKTLFGALTITAFMVSSAYSGMGVSLMYGQVETDGTETERTVSGVTSETNSASFVAFDLVKKAGLCRCFPYCLT